MSWLSDITDYLAAQGFGTVATDLFEGTMPDDSSVPDKCVSVQPYDAANIERFGTDELQPYFQVRIRGDRNVYTATLTRATSIWNALHVGRGTISGIECVRTMSGPLPLGPDTNMRHEFTINCEATLV